jgi:hypothetical protein
MVPKTLIYKNFTAFNKYYHLSHNLVCIKIFTYNIVDPWPHYEDIGFYISVKHAICYVNTSINIRLASLNLSQGRI